MERAGHVSDQKIRTSSVRVAHVERSRVFVERGERGALIFQRVSRDLAAAGRQTVGRSDESVRGSRVDCQPKAYVPRGDGGVV